MDEVCDSKKCPTMAVKPHLKRRIVLPLEGKGDRSAVDEVNCEHLHCRGANRTEIQKDRVSNAVFSGEGGIRTPDWVIPQ